MVATRNDTSAGWNKVTTCTWTPSQTPISNKAREALPSTSKSTCRSLLNTPVQSQTPMLTKTPSSTPGTQNIAHQQTLLEAS